MKKIIQFIKKNYIIFTVVLALILIIIGSMIIIGLLNNYQRKIETKTEEVELYEYFEYTKTEFKGKLSFENDQIVKIESDEAKINEEGIIYYQDKVKVILPRDTSMVFYYQNNIAYKLPTYSEIEYTEGAIKVTSEGKEYLLNDFFIYDGENTYFLPSPTVLTVGEQKVELSRFSYVIARSEDIVYYDKENDIVGSFDINTKANIQIGNIYIDIVKNATVENGNVGILVKDIDTLSTYKED